MAWKKWLGVGLVLLSGVWFGCIFVVPFMPMSIVLKAVLGTSFLVLMEVTFWVGTLIVGKQVISRYWQSIKYYFRINRKSENTDEHL